MSEAPNPTQLPAPVIPTTSAAPMSTAAAVDDLAATADALEKTAKQLRQERLRAWGGVPVTDITVVIGTTDPTGARREIVHQIQGDMYRIVKCDHSVEERMTAVREEKSIIGFEPTGEYILDLKVKFIKE